MVSYVGDRDPPAQQSSLNAERAAHHDDITVRSDARHVVIEVPGSFQAACARRDAWKPRLGIRVIVDVEIIYNEEGK